MSILPPRIPCHLEALPYLGGCMDMQIHKYAVETPSLVDTQYFPLLRRQTKRAKEIDVFVFLVHKAIFAKYATFANFYGPPSLLCALPRWWLWQNCHFCHLCQIANFYGPPLLLCALPCWRLWQNCHIYRICLIRRRFLFFAIFVGACFSGHVSWKKRMLPEKQPRDSLCWLKCQQNCYDALWTKNTRNPGTCAYLTNRWPCG